MRWWSSNSPSQARQRYGYVGIASVKYPVTSPTVADRAQKFLSLVFDRVYEWSPDPGDILVVTCDSADPFDLTKEFNGLCPVEVMAVGQEDFKAAYADQFTAAEAATIWEEINLLLRAGVQPCALDWPGGSFIVGVKMKSLPQPFSFAPAPTKKALPS